MRGEGAAAGVGQSVSFAQNPVVVNAGQQIAAVKPDGVGQPPRSQRSLEFSHVRRDGGGFQSNVHAVGGKNASGEDARRFQQTAQRSKRLAQTLPPRAFFRLRPQLPGQLFSSRA